MLSLQCKRRLTNAHLAVLTRAAAPPEISTLADDSLAAGRWWSHQMSQLAAAAIAGSPTPSGPAAVSTAAAAAVGHPRCNKNSTD